MEGPLLRSVLDLTSSDTSWMDVCNAVISTGPDAVKSLIFHTVNDIKLARMERLKADELELDLRGRLRDVIGLAVSAARSVPPMGSDQDLPLFLSDIQTQAFQHLKELAAIQSWLDAAMRDTQGRIFGFGPFLRVQRARGTSLATHPTYLVSDWSGAHFSFSC